MAPTSKPDKLPEYATTDRTDPTTGQNNVIEPPTAKKTYGWNFLEKPARNWMNWLHRKTYEWLTWFNQFFTSDGKLKINEINEFDSGQGVTIDGSLIKDGDMKLDSVTEKTSDTGVTVDGTTIKDGVLTDDGSEGVGIEEVNGDILRTKIIEIGDWNMDGADNTSVAHGLTYSKIKHISATIRNDDDTLRTNLLVYKGGQTGFNRISADSTNIVLYSPVSGYFDTTDYNATSYNRGWIIIQYTD